MATKKSMEVIFAILIFCLFCASAEAQTAEENLKQKNITLRAPISPVGNYVPAVRSGNLLFVSACGPGYGLRGKLGKDLSIEQGYQAARATGLTLLATVREELGSLDKVKRVVKVFGMVNSAPGFTEQPKVINGISDLIVEVFGPKIGGHARAAVGMAELPFNIPVNIEMVVEVE
jgi:enamine deaminase RidA (YjgF/YER057c/UK114 family)